MIWMIWTIYESKDVIQYTNNMSLLPQLSTWLVGAANGYTNKTGGVPMEVIAGTMIGSSTLAIIKNIESITKVSRSTPGQIGIGVALVFGTIFFVGDQVGRSLRVVKDDKP